MTCKRINTEFAQFSADESSLELMEEILKNCKMYPDGPACDFDIKTGKLKGKKREQHQTCRDIITALALCNNVTPVQSEFVPSIRLSQVGFGGFHHEPSLSAAIQS